MSFPSIHVDGELVDAVWVNDIEQRASDAIDQKAGSVLSVITITSAYPVTAADDVIFADASLGQFDITLLSATTVAQKFLYICATTLTTNRVRLVTAGESIIAAGQPGAATMYLGTLASGAVYAAVSMISDGANWRVL